MGALFRILISYLLAHPVLTFSLVATAAVGFSVYAYLRAAKRNKELAEIADDEEAASSHARNHILVILVTFTLISLGLWFFVFRVDLEPQRVLVSVEISSGEQKRARFWDPDDGARAATWQLADSLATVGLEALYPDPDWEAKLEGTSTTEEMLAQARSMGAAHMVVVELRLDKGIELPGADFQDYVFSGSGEVFDVASGTSTPLEHPPARLFVWGSSPSEAVERNDRYVAGRFEMPVIEVLARSELLTPYAAESRSSMTADEMLSATSLEPLFSRATNHLEALALRKTDVEQAEAAPESEASGLEFQRLGDALAEEYWIGNAADGRSLLMVEDRELTTQSGSLGYEISREGERLVLVDPALERAEVFEHYNFYSYPGLSADGKTVGVVLANHGASKTLAMISVPDGELFALQTHPHEYYSTPVPSPDGSTLAFFSQPGRREAATLESIARSGEGRRALAEPGEVRTAPVWSGDGKTLFAPLIDPDVIVAIDVSSGERTHLLGISPEDYAENLAALEAAAVEEDDEGGPEEQADELLEAVDPRRTSRFLRVAAGEAGGALWVVEIDDLGGRHVGRFELGTGEYTRVARELDADRLVAHPSRAAVALVSDDSAIASPRDPSAGDDEVYVLEADGTLKPITANAEDDVLLGWSREGDALFIQRAAREIRVDRWVNRVYRYTP